MQRAFIGEEYLGNINFLQTKFNKLDFRTIESFKFLSTCIIYILTLIDVRKKPMIDMRNRQMQSYRKVQKTIQ